MWLQRDTRGRMNLLIKATMWGNMNMSGWSVRGQYHRIAAFCIKCEACGFMRQISSTHLAGAGRTIRPPRGVCKPSSERVPHHNSGFASVCWKDLFQMWGSSDVSKMCWGSLRGHTFVCLLEIVANKQSMELMTRIVSLKSIDFYTLILDYLYVVSVSTLFGFRPWFSNVAVSRGSEKTHLSPLKGQ